MKEIFNDLNRKYNSSSIVEKLIFLNILLYVIIYVETIFTGNSNFIYNLFKLPARFDLFTLKPWSIITYSVFNTSFLDLIFNLILLFFFGNLFLDFFIPKKLLTFYIMGSLWGGCFFIATYHIFPQLQENYNSLVGASSAISAIIIGLATYMPNYEMKFRFIGYVKLLYIALVILAWDILNLAGNNTGGHIAHLGGATYGFFSIYYRNSFNFSNFFKAKKKKKSPLKTAYKSKSVKNSKPKNDNQAEIDKILDKIGQSGYDSLSQQEKEFLFNQRK